MTRPPRLAEWMLSRFVWADERSAVLGDLEEQFHDVVSASGPAAAHIWYWLEAAHVACGLWWLTRRDTGKRGTVMAMDDVRYAVRRLWKQPLTSAISIVTLGCAIGAAAATWSLISAVLLQPLPVREPERLFQVMARYETSRGPQISTSHTYPRMVTLRNAGVMPLAAFGSITAPTPLLVQAAGEARPRAVTFTSHNYLDVLGVQVSLGRFFTDAEDRGKVMVAVLSHRFWREEFQSDPTVIGRVIRVRDRQVEIIGVAPRGFRGLTVRGTPSLFMPLHTIDDIQRYEGLYGESPPAYWVQIVGRLPDGVSQVEMEGRLAGLRFDGGGQPRTLLLTDVTSASIGESSRADVRQFSALLASTVALLVAIGSLTVGMLLMLRTEARGGEFALCLALGASRARLAAGVAMEAVILTLCGALLALPVSLMLFAGLHAYKLPGSIRVDRLELSLDGRVLVGTAGAALVSVLLMGAVASLFGLRRDASIVRAPAGVTPRLTRRRSRGFLVTAQVAVTLVLVTGAGLFARSVTRALSLNPGIDGSQLLTGRITLDAYGYNSQRAGAFLDQLRARLSGHPAVVSLGLSQSPTGSGRIRVDGQTRQLPTMMYHVGIDDHYLRTIGLPVTTGRAFGPNDHAGAPGVAIVSASLARAIAGAGSSVGRRIEWSSFPGDNSSAEIVGVVPDLVKSVGVLQPLRLYMPIAQQHVFSMPGRGVTLAQELSVRATGDPAAASEAVMVTVRSLDPDIRPDPLQTMDASFLEEMATQRFGMTVLGALGAIALLLSLLGVYVLAASAAALRRREMGIRAAMGASGHHLRGLLMSETLKMVGGGVLLGWGVSWLGASTIRAFLFQVEPFDPLVTGSVAVAIITVALAVSLRPAVYASRLDLARVLRED